LTTDEPGCAAGVTFSLETSWPEEIPIKPGSLVSAIGHLSTDWITLVKIRLEISCDWESTPVAA
jgi:hypothetical protein